MIEIKSRKEGRHGQREVGRPPCLVRGEGQSHQGGVVPPNPVETGKKASSATKKSARRVCQEDDRCRQEDDRYRQEDCQGHQERGRPWTQQEDLR